MSRLIKKSSSNLKKVRGATTRPLPKRFGNAAKSNEISADDILEQTEDTTEINSLQLEEDISEPKQQEASSESDTSTNSSNAEESSTKHSDADDSCVTTYLINQY